MSAAEALALSYGLPALAGLVVLGWFVITDFMEGR